MCDTPIYDDNDVPIYADNDTPAYDSYDEEFLRYVADREAVEDRRQER